MLRKAAVFDLDGTIFPTHRIEVPAVIAAMHELGIEPAPAEAIMRRIGETRESSARSLLPYAGEEIRARFIDLARRNVAGLLQEHVECYQGIRELLDDLRRRGYTLGICSNGSESYITRVLEACGVVEHFRHISGRRPLRSKSERLRETLDDMRAEFAVFVGDREIDIEAACVNQLPCIGARYGYGSGETDLATFTADTAGDVLSHVLRCEIFHQVSQRTRALPSTGPRIIGVNGVDASGKTMFAIGLSRYLASLGLKAEVIHLDDFHNPKSVRSCEGDEIRAYLDHAFDLNTLESRLLRPIRRDGCLAETLTLLDLDADTYSVQKRFAVDRDTVVILEGVLLYRPPIDRYLDLRVFLDVPFEETLRRVAVRDASLFGPSVVARYHAKYIPAQKLYMAEHAPIERSDIVIDNTNYSRPHVTRLGIA